MELNHLAQDELDYEMTIRNIGVNMSDRLGRLQRILDSEATGEVDDPLDTARLTRCSVSKELRECEIKVRQLADVLENAFREVNEELVECGMSRLAHVAGRIRRLLSFAPDHAAILRLNARVKELGNQAVDARDSFGSGEHEANIDDAELAGAWGPLQTQTTSQVDEQPASGTRPKTTQKSSTPSKLTNNGFQNLPKCNQQRPSQGRQSLPDRVSMEHRDQLDPKLVPRVRRFFDTAIIDARQTTERESQRSQPPPYFSNRSEPYIDQRSTFSQQGNLGLAGGHCIHKWTLRFDGSPKSLEAEDFVFRAERQAQLYGVTQRALVIGIGNLLAGRAAQWYWTYQRQVEDATWDEFKQAFLRRYAPHRQSDYEIRSKIENRRQQQGESFNDFCQDIEALEVRLIRRMAEAELVEILRRNMSMSLRKALWKENTRTVDDLLQYCSEYELLCNEEEKQMGHRKSWRVNEVMHREQQGRHFAQSMQPTNSMDDGCDPQVEAMKLAGNPGELAICWNCSDIGHVFSQCPHRQMAVFCFTCGKKDVISVNCPKCSVNSRRGQPTAESARPAPMNQPPGTFRQSHPPPSNNPFNRPNTNTQQ